MGLDFVRQRAADFHRSWDQHREKLGTPTLFSVDPECSSRTLVATTTKPLEKGKRILIRTEEGDLSAYVGLTRVAQFVSPPPDVIAAIRQSGGYAEGCVVSNAGERVVEVALC